jgi:hypothetical protein
VRVSMPQCRVDYDPMPPFDVMVDLYAGADFGASDMLAGAELLGSGRTAVSSMVCGARAEPVLSVQIPIPDGIDRVYLRLRFVQPGTTVLMPYAMAGTGTQSVFPEFKRALERIGQTESGYGRDMNGDGVFSGGLSVITGAAMGAHEHRQVNAGPPIRGLAVRLRGYLGCGPDINGNGLIDQQDVVDLIRVVAGGYATSGDDPDFNRDGNLDQQDVYDLIQAVAGGGCP